MGGEIFHMGPLGSAAVIKVITNMLAFIHLVAAGEALMLAKRGGLDLAQAFHAIKASSGNSFVHETEGQLILNGSYDIDFTMDLALKDLGFAIGFGREFGVPLDLAGLTTQTFERGHGSLWRQRLVDQVVKLLEDALQDRSARARDSRRNSMTERGSHLDSITKTLAPARQRLRLAPPRGVAGAQHHRRRRPVVGGRRAADHRGGIRGGPRRRLAALHGDHGGLRRRRHPDRALRRPLRHHAAAAGGRDRARHRLRRGGAVDLPTGSSSCYRRC